MKNLKAPFPYFGGKSKVVDIVWERFGGIKNYIEPFAGSAAMLLGAPEGKRVETINDLDGFITNFWRAVKLDPQATARWADDIVSELDLHARHQWLIQRREGLTGRLREDPEYFDAKIAGWWVWGISLWIGSGWCERVSKKLPHLGGGGVGVHRSSIRLPHLGNEGMGETLYEMFDALSRRLRRVRVCSGSWERVCSSPTTTTRFGLTGVFLDPPYSRGAIDYAVGGVGSGLDAQVREWCKEWGGDPLMRIALCGYKGDHDELLSLGWSAHAWKTNGGYANSAKGETEGKQNSKSEVILFSPNCLPPEQVILL